MPHEEAANVELLGRTSLEATVIYACPHCQAPGAYHDDPSIQEGWPGCHVAADDPRNHQPVGETCPNCEKLRSPDKPLGEVWYKEWWGRIFTRGSRT